MFYKNLKKSIALIEEIFKNSRENKVLLFSQKETFIRWDIIYNLYCQRIDNKRFIIECEATSEGKKAEYAFCFNDLDEFKNKINELSNVLSCFYKSLIDVFVERIMDMEELILVKFSYSKSVG